jgi:purine nucleosidase
MTRKCILDVDLGIDDSLALTILLKLVNKQQFNLLGITNVFGNASVEDSTKNAILITQIARYNNIPIVKGVSDPLKQKRRPFPVSIHGKDGIGNNQHIRCLNRDPIKESATDFIIRQVNKYPNEVTIFAVGPLTNIASALQKDTNIKDNIKEIFIMGGAFFVPGNVTPFAEANVFNDILAAKIVMETTWRCTVLPLDVTTKVILYEPLQRQIKDIDPLHLGCLHYKAFNFYNKFHCRTYGFNGAYIHDVHAIVYSVKPDLYQTVSGDISVVLNGNNKGQTTIIQNSQSTTKVARSVNSDDVIKCIFEILN